MSNKKIVVYMDRDGVINKQYKDKFVNSIDDFEFILGVPQAIKKLNQNNIMTIVVTNQGGIELGKLTEEDFEEITDYMQEKLKSFGAKIDHVYFCSSLDKNNYYRKPNPGMIIESSKELKLNNYKKYMIGDRVTDIEAGNKANCITILVKSGEPITSSHDKSGRNSINTLNKIPNHICDNLTQAVNLILKENK